MMLSTTAAANSSLSTIFPSFSAHAAYYNRDFKTPAYYLGQKLLLPAFNYVYTAGNWTWHKVDSSISRLFNIIPAAEAQPVPLLKNSAHLQQQKAEAHERNQEILEVGEKLVNNLRETIKNIKNALDGMESKIGQPLTESVIAQQPEPLQKIIVSGQTKLRNYQEILFSLQSELGVYRNATDQYFSTFDSLDATEPLNSKHSDQLATMLLHMQAVAREGEDLVKKAESAPKKRTIN